LVEEALRKFESVKWNFFNGRYKRGISDIW
jgi:hypothetical protein